MDVKVKPLAEADVTAADNIFRTAFATYFGMPPSQRFMGDAELIGPRRRAYPESALGAYDGNDLVGSSFATRWGSFAFLGPITVRPDLWDKGVAKKLVEATVALFDRWGVKQGALFTFPQSVKHIGLYQKFGFWPQYLTPVMSKPATKADAGGWSRLSMLPPAEQKENQKQCVALTEKIYSGLDVTPEIRSIADQRMGDTILISDKDGVAGFACCHVGAGSEAGSGTTFVKFGAVRPGANASKLFDQLLFACEAFATASGCKGITAGVNAARHQAYKQMIAYGFRTVIEGVAMLRPNEPGFNRPDYFVIDDLR